MAADDLRRQCDEFIDIATLKIRREPSERVARDAAAGRAPGNPGLERRYGIRGEGDEASS
jgi:hypothetical protein